MLRVCVLSFLFFHIGNASNYTAEYDSELAKTGLSSGANYNWTDTNSIEIEARTIVDNNGCPVCIRKYLVGKQKVNFNTAVLLCNQIGMEIASPMSAEENNAIIKTCRESAPGIELFWIGGKRCTGCLSEFIWISSAKPVVYRNFMTGQPNNVNNNQNCLRYEQQNKVLRWNDWNCDDLLAFVCQSKCCCNNN